VRLPVLNHSASDSDSSAEGVVDSLKTAVRTLSSTAEFPKVDMVGPKVSGGFSDATILAILLAGTGMLGYLWIRFESHFAAAATLTIALDRAKTTGFFALPMLFGIVVDTSSSIFIAAPLLYWLGQRRQQKGLPQLRPSREERDAELALIP
jgi:preprotein translocase subunit SecF